jgi:PAS domain S-box-containing protein
MGMEKGATGRDAKILIVEDSLTQAMLLKHLLDERGYRVERAVSGKAALECLTKEIPDLIISDIVMPEMDGFELSRAIKSNKNLCDIPVILLTQLTDPEDVVKGLEARVDFYLTKPYDEEFLLSRVESIVNNPAHQAKEERLTQLEVNLWGKTYPVSLDPERALSLLASTYENAIQINTALHREITERKRVEEELRVTVARLKQMEAIIEISPAVAFVRRASDGWPVEFVSDNVLQFDYEAEDLLDGRIRYAEVVHPEDRERVFAEVEAYARDRDIEEFSQEYRILTGYGETRWVDDRTFVRRNSKGVVTHFQGIILDVTDRKRASS